MKKWIGGLIILGVFLSQLITTPIVSASSLEDIRQQQEQTQEEIDSLESQVNRSLEDISEISEVLNQLNSEIEEKEQSIEAARDEVLEQENIVESRMEQARQRLQTLQTNEVNRNIILTILESESISDLFNRTLVILQLTDAGNQHIEIAQEEHDKLVELQQKLLAAQEDLTERELIASEQKEVLDEKVSSLQTVIQENYAQLTELVEREETEVARIEEERRIAREEAARAAAEREEAAAAEALAQQQAQAAQDREEQVVSTSSSSQEQASSNKTSTASSTSAEESSTPAEESQQSSSNNQSGRTITVQATGYSTQQANLSSHTATGINLLQNPRVIAVDPSVIPLGSMVEVEGMGVYIAGDTGGAIRGKIIDIHFTTVNAALRWGRRTVNIRILD